MLYEKLKTNRKHLTVTSIAVSILLAAVLLQLSTARGSAYSEPGSQDNQGSFSGAIVEVVPDISLDGIRMLSAGPFIIKGKIFQLGTLDANGMVPTGAKEIGVWRAWGHVLDEGGLVVNQSYDLTSFLGTIQTQGIEFDNPLNGKRLHSIAIVGGTGTYASATGEAVIKILNTTTGSFRFRMLKK